MRQMRSGERSPACHPCFRVYCDWMSWETPDFVEIRMDAEIGSYQQDDSGPNDPVVEEAPAAE